MRVVIREVAGPWAVALQEGQRIHDLIAPAIARGEPVELDFEGVKRVAPPFLNPVVGWLIQEHSPAHVEPLLQVVNLPPLGPELLREVIELGRQCWASPAYREALGRTLDALSEDR